MSFISFFMNGRECSLGKHEGGMMTCACMIMSMLAITVWLILRVEIPLHWTTRCSKKYEMPGPLRAFVCRLRLQWGQMKKSQGWNLFSTLSPATALHRPMHVPIFPSRHQAILFTWMLVVITTWLSTDKRFCLVEETRPLSALLAVYLTLATGNGTWYSVNIR